MSSRAVVSLLLVSMVSHLQMKIVSDSDHLFRDLYVDDAIDDIVAFLKKQRV